MQRVGRPVKVAVGDRGHKKFQPTIIRAPPFYQNIYGVLGTLTKGMFYYPLGNPSGTLCHVDYQDVGKAIATVLEEGPEKHGGKAYNIIGERQTGNQMYVTFSIEFLTFSAGGDNSKCVCPM